MVLKLNIDFALEEVTPNKLELLQAVFDAHDMAARNNQNASSGAAVNAFFGSAQLTNAIASAILTLGDAHGPIGPARFVYEKFDERSLKSAILSRTSSRLRELVLQGQHRPSVESGARNY